MVSAGLPLPGWSELDDPDEPLDPLLLLESLPQPAAMAATTTSAASKARVGANDMDAPLFSLMCSGSGPARPGRRTRSGARGWTAGGRHAARAGCPATAPTTAVRRRRRR